MVELITVIILLGIISSIAIPRFFSEKTFTDSFDRSKLDSAISWARNRAVTSQCTHEMRITNTGWQVFRDVSCSTTIVEVAPCTTETLNLSIASKDAVDDLLNGDAPTVAAANSPQRLIFTATGQLFLNTSSPAVSGCTAMPTVPLANNSSISILPSGTLTLDGATAYVAIQ